MGRDWASRVRSDPPNPDAGPTRLEAAQIIAALEGSLRRLQTDYIDLYQVGRGGLGREGHM